MIIFKWGSKQRRRLRHALSFIICTPLNTCFVKVFHVARMANGDGIFRSRAQRARSCEDSSLYNGTTYRRTLKLCSHQNPSYMHLRILRIIYCSIWRYFNSLQLQPCHHSVSYTNNWTTNDRVILKLSGRLHAVSAIGAVYISSQADLLCCAAQLSSSD